MNPTTMISPGVRKARPVAEHAPCLCCEKNLRHRPRTGRVAAERTPAPPFEHVPNKEKQPRMMTDQRPIDRWMNCWVGTDDDRRHTADDDYQEAALTRAMLEYPAARLRELGAAHQRGPGPSRRDPPQGRRSATRCWRPTRRIAPLSARGGAMGRRVSAVRRRQRAGLGTPERRPRKIELGTSRKTLRLLGLNMLEPADDLDLEPAEADA